MGGGTQEHNPHRLACNNVTYTQKLWLLLGPIFIFFNAQQMTVLKLGVESCC